MRAIVIHFQALAQKWIGHASDQVDWADHEHGTILMN
jgi:hypothetical protein